MNILFVGPLWIGSTSRQRLLTLEELGQYVISVDTSLPSLPLVLSSLNRVSSRLGVYLDLSGANNLILENIDKNIFDIIWIEKGLTIKPNTLKKIKEVQPSSKLVAFSPDNMLLAANQSSNYLNSIPILDWHITTKSFNVSGLKQLGARDVHFIEKAFDPNAYHPIKLSNVKKANWGSDVAFLGGYEKQRYEMMLALAKRGIVITIWGPGWERCGNSHPNLIIKPGWVQAEDAAKVFCGTNINLHFLRKSAHDLQTARSVEIPACGAFMLAERTVEHQGLFKEGIEAEFFDDIEELFSKIIYYLEHSEQRTSIAIGGYQRCLKSGYSNHDRLREILNVITCDNYKKNF